MNLILALALSVSAVDEKAELGKVVPDLVLKDLAGKEIKLSDFRKDGGKVVLVHFWSYKCPSGAKIMDKVRTLAEKCGTDVQFIGICSYGESEADLKKYAEESGIKYTLCYDTDKKGAKLFDAKVVTASYVLDKEGKLVYRGNPDKVWDAVEAAKNGKEVAEKETKAKG